MDRTTRGRLPILVGAAGLTLALVGFLVAASPDSAPEPAGRWWLASLAGAGIALVCGLAARGRPATMALVVPSLVYLVVTLAPF